MKPFHAILVSASCLMLGACSISIEDDSPYAHEYHDSDSSHISVTLPSGRRDSFSCPKGTDAFVRDRTDEGDGLIYGCRTSEANIDL